MGTPGRATPEGTSEFAANHPEAAEGHFRQAQGLTVSSVGLGTYLGDDDEAVDAGYGAALSVALDLGCNVVDTAIVYRNQRSERALGRVLISLFSEEVVTREQVVIATKGGYLAHDGAFDGTRNRYITETLVEPGIITADDIVAGSHCMTPRFLRSQLDISRRNLDCEGIDLYYLHNPEAQLEEVDRPEFLGRIRAAFGFLEEAVAAGEIGMYGVATWTGFRVASHAAGHLSLPELVACAVDVAGDGHHFRALQLPLNLGMPEAVTMRNQTGRAGDVSVLEAAADLGLTVMASASLLQSRLAADLSPRLRDALAGGVTTDAQRAIQFVRSAPGLTTALVGMSNPAHAVENCVLESVAPLTAERFAALVSS